MSLGWWSIILLVGAVNACVLAIPLWRAQRNRTANRVLAALLVVAALRLMPYVLGYAGAYDAYRWLTFAPFSLTLLFGPLLWGYTVALTTGALPRHWLRHLVPGAIQFAYSAACFTLPLEAKWDWYTGGHQRYVEPLLVFALFLSLFTYLLRAVRQYGRYRRWLDDHLSNNDEVRRPGLGFMLMAFGLMVAVAFGFALVDVLVRPLDFFDQFPVMLSLAALTYVLGLAGWRDAERAFPRQGDVVMTPEPLDSTAAVARTNSGNDVDSEPHPAEPGVAEPRVDYTALAAEWSGRVREQRWFRDAGLTREGLAERLGTSPRTLSRVLNHGSGESFHQFVNRLRVAEVQEELAGPSERDVLLVALDAGFSSKASFNRVFKQVTGLTPTAWRARAREGGENPDARSHFAPT